MGAWARLSQARGCGCGGGRRPLGAQMHPQRALGCVGTGRLCPVRQRVSRTWRAGDVSPWRGVCAAVWRPGLPWGRGPGSGDRRGGDRQLSAGQLGPDLHGRGGLVGPFLPTVFTRRYGRPGGRFLPRPPFCPARGTRTRPCARKPAHCCPAGGQGSGAGGLVQRLWAAGSGHLPVPLSSVYLSTTCTSLSPTHPHIFPSVLLHLRICLAAYVPIISISLGPHVRPSIHLSSIRHPPTCPQSSTHPLVHLRTHVPTDAGVQGPLCPLCFCSSASACDGACGGGWERSLVPPAHQGGRAGPRGSRRQGVWSYRCRGDPAQGCRSGRGGGRARGPSRLLRTPVYSRTETSACGFLIFFLGGGCFEYFFLFFFGGEIYSV